MNKLVSLPLPIAQVDADESPEEFLREFMPEIRERFNRCDSSYGNGRASESLCETTLERESIVIIHAINEGEEPAFEPYLFGIRTMSGRTVWVRAVADLYAAKKIRLQSGDGLIVEWFFSIRE